MPRPVIGLTSYLEPAAWGARESQAVLIHDWYVDVPHEAGAEVVVLPPENSPQVVDRCDGLLLAGGGDVESPLVVGKFWASASPIIAAGLDPRVADVIDSADSYTLHGWDQDEQEHQDFLTTLRAIDAAVPTP